MVMPLREVPDEKPNTNAVRRRALQRLYLRKAAVDDLIESLENYVKTQRTTAARATCISISEARRWS